MGNKLIIRYIRTLLILPLFLFFAALSLIAEEVHSFDVKEVLDGGATVICKYVEDSPIVTIQLRVMSGLSNEGKYAGSGISHFLEHLLFKGTDENDSENIRRQIKSMGGIVNGSTGMDSAEYHITVPNRYFSEAAGLLINMVMSPVFTDDDMDAERNVILNEIKMRNDDPLSRRIKLLFSNSYSENVYKYPVIGYEEKFRSLSRDDVSAYHADAYTPDRIIIGIAGGVEPEEAVKTIERDMIGYSVTDLSYPDVTKEPLQRMERKEKFFTDVTLGYIAIGFHTSSIYSPDIYPGDVLSIILGEGNGSRLYERLVKDKQLLYTVSSVNYTPKYPGLFVITGIGDPGKLEEARKEIFNVIGDMRDEVADAVELEKARNMALSGYLHSNESMDSIVSNMTVSEMLMGNPDFMLEYTRDIRNVDNDDIEAFISKYLITSNSTTVLILPYEYEDVPLPGETGSVKEGGTPASSGRSFPDTVGAPGIEPGEKREKVPGRMISDADEGGRRGQNQEELTAFMDNGLKIIVKERRQLPIVTVTLSCKGGLLMESERNNGISNLTSSLLLKGTKNRTESDIVPVIERKGGMIKSYSGMNSMGLSMDILSDNFDESLDIFEDAVKNSVFPDEEIQKMKDKIIAGIKEDEKDIFNNGVDHLRAVLYGDHPYSMKISGDISTVEALDKNDMEKFYRENIVPQGTVITVVGDVDAEKIIEDIKSRFSSWSSEGVNSGIGGGELLSGRLRKEITMGKQQTLLIEGYPGARVDEDDKYTLDVISAILSGSDGILFSDLREAEGLAYASGAVSVPEVDTGYFVIYVATGEENLDKAENGVTRALERVISGDISSEDIESSKNRLITQKAQSLETNFDISLKMALDELYGEGYGAYRDYEKNIRSVTREDIINTAKKVFLGRTCATVVIHSSLYTDE